MPAGFEPGTVYELVYTSQDPALVGLGPTAIRDMISFLKYGGNDITVLGDQHRYLKRAYGYRRVAERPLPAHLSLLRIQRATRRAARCSTACWRTSPAPGAAVSICASRSPRATAIRS